MTKTDILDYLKSHKPDFEKKYRVSKIGLFGSYVKNQSNDESDIDLFVEMKPDLYMVVGLKQQIEHDLQKKVDLVTKHKHIKPLLLEMIEKEIEYV